MSNTLEKLAKLRDAIEAATDERAAAETWTLVEQIESDLEGDPRLSNNERQSLQHLKSGVSDFIRAHREGLNPYAGTAQIAISALVSSLRKRTTGEDGWPLG